MRLNLLLETAVGEGAFNSKDAFGIAPELNTKFSRYYNHKDKKSEGLLRQFKNDQFNVLICTDAIGRGFDIEVDFVINYDAPLTLKTYIHRVGRTARAGKEGTSFTFLTGPEIESYKSKLSARAEMTNLLEEFIIPHKRLNRLVEPFRFLIDKYKEAVSKSGTWSNK